MDTDELTELSVRMMEMMDDLDDEERMTIAVIIAVRVLQDVDPEMFAVWLTAVWRELQPSW